MGFGGGAGAWYLSRGGKRDKDSCEVGFQMKNTLSGFKSTKWDINR